MPYTFVNGPIPAVDFETITVSTVAIGLTAGKLKVVTELTARSGGQDTSFVEVKRPDEVLITVESNPCRFRIDGTDPTAAVGHLLNAGDSIIVVGFGNLNRLKLIRSGAADATIQVTYYRKG